MSENEKNVPKRRFKEFENTKAWEQRKLTDEVELYSGLTYSPNDVIKEGGTLVLRSSNVKNGEVINADNVYVKSDVVNSDNVQEGDVIVVVRNGSRSLIGKHGQIKAKMDNTVIGAFMTGMRSSNAAFTNALLSTPVFDKEVEKNLGATINQITNRMFQSMHFMFPNEKEQIKIGDYFTKLDNLITLHQRKLEKIKALKNAYLSEMFPAEGECKPKRRFAGFTDDWEQRKLGDAFTQTVGYVNPKLENIELWSLTLEKGLTPKTERYIRDFLVLKEDKYKEVRPNDVVYNPMNMTLGAIGYNDMPITVAVSGYYVTMKPSNSIDGYYIKTWMQLAQSIELYKAHATGSLLEKQRVQYPTFSEIKFTVPSLVEQQKIGAFFRNLDNLITLHQRKLEKLQNIKKAYLNEMFI